MTRDERARLSKRERDVMDVLYRLGVATVGDVLRSLTDAPSDSALRSTLRILERKGHVRRSSDGVRNVYHPTIPVEQAGRTALSALLATFFHGSRERAVAALLSLPDGGLTEEEVRRLTLLLERHGAGAEPQ